MFFLVFICLAVICIVLHLLFSKSSREKNKIYEIILLYLLFWFIGIMGILNFRGHAFMADEIAKEIGYPPGSPFQFEVAMANLAFGVLGILCIWFRNTFWLATIIGSGIFLFGDGIGHIYQTLVKKDYAEYNAGIVLYTDLIMPIVLLILYFLYKRNQSPNIVDKYISK